MSRSDDLQNSGSGKKKIKKKHGPPADEDTLFQMINDLRATMGLHQLKPNHGFADMTDAILKDEVPLIDEQEFVVTSLLTFWDMFDGKQSAASLIAKWMKEPNRRPVLLASGKHGKVVIEYNEEDQSGFVVLIIASIFH